MLKYNCVNSKKIEYAQFFLVYGKEQKINLTDFQKRKFSYMCMI